MTALIAPPGACGGRAMRIRFQQWLAVQREPSWPFTLLGLALLLAWPTFTRGLLNAFIGDSLWFAAYYPPVLIGGVLLATRASILLWLLSGLAANYWFLQPTGQITLGQRELALMLLYYASAGVILLFGMWLRSSLIRLNEANGRERLINRELRHRIKNILAVVQTLARQSASSSLEDPEAFDERFGGRLSALGTALDLLAQSEWQECRLPELSQMVLAPFASSGRIVISGPHCLVPPEVAEPLALILHELATNAIKYGALSVPGGTVHVSWLTDTASPAPSCELAWRESGGPPVKAPHHVGFGMRLITSVLGGEAVRLDFAEDGVNCTIRLATAKEAAGAATMAAARGSPVKNPAPG